MMTQQFFTPDDLAERWKINKGLIYKMVADHRLRPTKIGKYLRFSASEVERFESDQGE
ncbi:MAG TPA: DNA-binding protein [Actinobacteria bacterium]|nr:DNA-binding protein [Actinomycetota bacterium]